MQVSKEALAEHEIFESQFKTPTEAKISFCEFAISKDEILKNISKYSIKTPKMKIKKVKSFSYNSPMWSLQDNSISFNVVFDASELKSIINIKQPVKKQIKKINDTIETGDMLSWTVTNKQYAGQFSQDSYDVKITVKVERIEGDRVYFTIIDTGESGWEKTNSIFKKPDFKRVN